MPRRTICISHATGAGGEVVGRAVAERLGFRYLDEEVLSEAAEWADLDPAFVADAERRKPLTAREPPTHFDVVVNTDVLTPHDAANIIVGVA
jgi:predicted TPR repeat methyltransferase